MVSALRRSLRANLYSSKNLSRDCRGKRIRGRGGHVFPRVDRMDEPSMDILEDMWRGWFNPLRFWVEVTPHVHVDFHEVFVNMGFATEGAEKSCLRTRRRKRGLRRGKRRSRGRHPRRSETPPARPSKPPNMRKVLHRRRPERWLIVASERLRADAKKFVQLKGDSYWSSRRRRSQKKYCMVKWRRLHIRATELGFPPKLSFDTSFFKWLNKEFPREGKSEIDEHALLFTKQPFTYFDPPEQFDPVMALLRGTGAPAGKRPSQGAIRTPGRKAPCRHCGGSNHGPNGRCPKLRSQQLKKG
jgi:hypothetical protein